MRQVLVAWFSTLFLMMVAAGAVHAASKDAVYKSSWSGVAINGYDPVAYFSEGKAVEGSDSFTHTWNDAIWRFASAESRDVFAANPEAYAPQYGGYCAWAVSQGYTASTDPEAWRVVDGKLYLNYSKGVQKNWEEDAPGNIAKADTNWPKVLE